VSSITRPSPVSRALTDAIDFEVRSPSSISSLAVECVPSS